MGDVTALRHCGGCAQRAWEARALPEPDVFPHPVGFSPTAGTDSPPQVSTKQLLGHPRTLPEPLVSSLNPEGAYVPVGPWEPEPVCRGMGGNRGEAFAAQNGLQRASVCWWWEARAIYRCH